MLVDKQLPMVARIDAEGYVWFDGVVLSKRLQIYTTYIAITLQSTIIITYCGLFQSSNHHSFKDMTILTISHLWYVNSYNNSGLIHRLIWKSGDMNMMKVDVQTRPFLIKAHVTLTHTNCYKLHKMFYVVDCFNIVLDHELYVCVYCNF